ncbi:DMT family transporter [Candidatus Micrarchaeota archaeon]|nr:DMT family transporter [Candidatus Micrarchaeota archaeon]
MSNEKGIMFGFITALISGVSIFVNSFGVSLSDPFVYTTIKNALVVVFILSTFFIFKNMRELSALTKKQIAQLVIIGLIGGSVPFLLFFYGLSLGIASVSSFIFRSLFIFASLMAVFYLKEKIDHRFFIGALIVFIGNFLLVKGDLAFGTGQIMVLIATLLWAIEYNYSRKVLAALSPRVVALGRMFFGSIFLLVFLGATGKINALFVISYDILPWTIIASLFLFLYVTFFYSALKYTTVSNATAALALGGPITALLNAVFIGKVPVITEIIGLLLTVIGAIVIIGISSSLKSILHLRENISALR